MLLFIAPFSLSIYVRNIQPEYIGGGGAAIALLVAWKAYRRKYNFVLIYSLTQIFLNLSLYPLFREGIIPGYDHEHSLRVQALLSGFCIDYPLIKILAVKYGAVWHDVLPIIASTTFIFIFLSVYFYYLKVVYAGSYGAGLNDAPPNHLWSQAAYEIDVGKDENLWIRCFAEADGSHERTKAIYIKTRAYDMHNRIKKEIISKAITKVYSDVTYAFLYSIVIIGFLLYKYTVMNA
jgi:hypothetical protein